MQPLNSSSNIDRELSTFAESLQKNPQIQKSASEAMDLLVADLEKETSSDLRNKIIQNAKNKYYSDFMSPIAMPKRQLISDLDAAGLKELAAKATHGRYDD